MSASGKPRDGSLGSPSRGPEPQQWARGRESAEVEALIREIQRYLVFVEALRGKDTGGGPPPVKPK